VLMQDLTPLLAKAVNDTEFDDQARSTLEA
jgi:hypothetical protein